MIRRIFRLIARLATSRRRPDPLALPAAESAQLRRLAMQPQVEHGDIDEYELFGWGLWGIE